MLWVIGVAAACSGATDRKVGSFAAGGAGGTTNSHPGGGKSSTEIQDPPTPTGGGPLVSSGGTGSTLAGASPGGGSVTAGSDAAGGDATDAGGRRAINSVCKTTSQCLTDAVCQDGFCTCPRELPDYCPDPNNIPGACVNRDTDPKNCGPCQRVCDMGAACNAGKCGTKPLEVVGTSECGAMRLAVQDDTLYFTKPLSGEVQAVSIYGGPTTDLTAPLQGTPTQIAVDTTGVYWVVEGNGKPGSSKVMKKPLPLAAGEPITLLASPDSTVIKALTVFQDKVYYSLGHNLRAISTDPAQTGDDLIATAMNGDEVNPQPDGEPAAIGVLFPRICWTAGKTNNVQFDGWEPGQGGFTEVAHALPGLLLTSVYCTNGGVYYANGARFQISEHLDGAYDLAQTPQGDAITAFAVDAAGKVYFAGANGGVYRQYLGEEVPTAPTALAQNQATINDMVLGTYHVFWPTSDCHIRSASK